MRELEALVERLERGDLPLEEALKQFERGVALTKSCQAALKAFRNARTSYSKVVSTWPESEAAGQARMRIEKLNAEGR